MQSAIIHKGTFYTACTVNDSLVVTKNRNQQGRIVVGDTAKEFIDAIKSAIDSNEAETLCKCLFNQYRSHRCPMNL